LIREKIVGIRRKFLKKSIRWAMEDDCKRQGNKVTREGRTGERRGWMREKGIL
jgi:hypothetical protein